MKRKIILLLLTVSIFSSGLFASNEFYQTGDTIFSFKTGATIPVAIDIYGDDSIYWGTDTGLSTGGIGAINFDYFYSSTNSLGLEIAYDFNYNRSDTLYSNIPIAALWKYYPIQNGTWDVPLTLGAGLSFNGLDGDVLLSLYSEVKAGVNYYVNQNWGIGLEAGLTFIPQFNYYEKQWSDNGFLSYAPLTLSVSYRK
jgi:hypothetical protein